MAPRGLRPRLRGLIEQRGPLRRRRATSTIKVNSIGDADMIEALYDASQAGVPHRPRRARHLVPAGRGAPGLSENIRVRSILGRYLEHSRIYRFAHGDVDDEPLYLIGSADVMPRNLDRRVEVLVPIEHPKHRDWLDQVLAFLLADDVVRWELQPDDTWSRVRARRTPSSRNAQERLYRWVVERQARPRSSDASAAGSARRPTAVGASRFTRRTVPVHPPFTDGGLIAQPALPTVRAGAPADGGSHARAGVQRAIERSFSA